MIMLCIYYRSSFAKYFFFVSQHNLNQIKIFTKSFFTVVVTYYCVLFRGYLWQFSWDLLVTPYPPSWTSSRAKHARTYEDFSHSPITITNCFLVCCWGSTATPGSTDLPRYQYGYCTTHIWWMNVFKFWILNSFHTSL